MRALISVSDKTGIVELAKELVSQSFEIVSTGETHRTLMKAGIPSVEIKDFTGFPEILGGRVKTLHPKVFGGILYRREDKQHQTEIRDHDIAPIDWVVVNLYPFEKINLEDKLPKSEMIEFIDIGGVSLLRAAAKNFVDVVVLCDQKDYSEAVKELKENKTISIDTRKMLAAKAFGHTAHYDSMISRFFRESGGGDAGGFRHPAPAFNPFPEELTLGIRKVSELRYGENPHQKAALYKESGRRDWGLVSAEKLGGKELSFNNYLDMDNVWKLARSFTGGDRTACAIVKHTNPCGVAIGKNALEAFQLAYACDSVSAFGGVLGFSSTVDGPAAKEITKTFFECIISPDYTQEALEILKTKPNLRILRQSATLTMPYELDIKKLSGGMMLQEMDYVSEDEPRKTISNRAPTPEESLGLEFAWKVCKHVKSNAIVLSRGEVTVGIGCGQMSRIDSLKIAIQKAGLMVPVMGQDPKSIPSPLRGEGQGEGWLKLPLVMASDAFFPFRDCVDEAAKAGISAIIQPGGSIRDKDSIDAANEHNMAMILTGTRHFLH